MKKTFVLSPYAKAVVAFIVGAVVFVGGLLTDGDWNLQDTISLVGWLAATFGVYQTPNKENVEIGGA